MLDNKKVQIDILRLDAMHPEISGNKWFKLKYNLQAAYERGAKSLLSFGGAYSNHLHALAFAGFKTKLKTIGIIRGEEVVNPTLQDCIVWGMDLHFISREKYRHKTEVSFLEEIQSKFPHAYIIPEGANNEAGLLGCNEILQGIPLANYQYIAASVGTATTLCGLINASLGSNEVLGFLAMKQGLYLEEEIKQRTTKTNWRLIDDYHFGGFGKSNAELFTFMDNFTTKHNIDLDRVYTAKMMYGMYDLIQANRFEHNAKFLVIHTGGLQGNRQ
ncbi:MAG: 1-aminocyclopropane-1-carboxylate deaminase/D-cysteine desulfhydrase [Bacteroidetes bacterium]|nr:1-aminocyclopropane-1-carboxylate deaminase/D-cysteine desulfhydrase [Bacteroidota bacterium]